MKRRVCLFALLLLTACPMYGGQRQKRPKRETWYEGALRRVNPADTDYGAMWEQRKREFIDLLGNWYFRYSVAATGAIIVLLVVLCALYQTYRQSLRVAVRSIADIRRHDEYARQTAREAIKRYNDHIESCNRMIESGESGASRWISNGELEALTLEVQQSKSESTALREEIKRLREEGERQKALVAEMSARAGAVAQPTLPFAQDSIAPEHVTLINELQQALLAERKKNQRLKGTSA